MLLNYLDISTAHIKRQTLKNLDTQSIPYSFFYDQGVFITVPENDDPEAFQKLPKDLRILLKYAWKNNATLIRLDADAEVVNDLLVYKWE